MAADHEEAAVDEQTLSRYNEDNGSGVIAIRSIDDIKRLSSMFITSGMFKGDKNLSQVQQIAQACVKIVAGVEFGIQPFAAVRGINIINGNAEMSANLMAAKVKKHPKYDYKVKQLDNDGCVITFYELPFPNAPRKEWEELGDSSFTHDDAVAAQLAGSQNWKKFARNMYFARAISNGVRFYTPDVFYGAPVYVEGEISGELVSEEQPAPTSREEASAKNELVEPIPEPQEAEVVVTDDAVETAPAEDSLEWLHEEIAEVARRKGYGTDWAINAIDKAVTKKIAQGVLDKLNEQEDAA